MDDHNQNIGAVSSYIITDDLCCFCRQQICVRSGVWCWRTPVAHALASGSGKQQPTIRFRFVYRHTNENASTIMPQFSSCDILMSYLLFSALRLCRFPRSPPRGAVAASTSRWASATRSCHRTTVTLSGVTTATRRRMRSSRRLSW